MALDKDKLLQYGAVSVGLTAVFFFLILREMNLFNLVDSFTLSGICFLILALFRTARYLHFYDLPIYSGKKFMELFRRADNREPKVGQYYEYIRTLEHPVDFKEAYVIAAALLLGSMLMTVFL